MGSFQDAMCPCARTPVTVSRQNAAKFSPTAGCRHFTHPRLRPHAEWECGSSALTPVLLSGEALDRLLLYFITRRMLPIPAERDRVPTQGLVITGSRHDPMVSRTRAERGIYTLMIHYFEIMDMLRWKMFNTA
jgi:hypothetical protein